MLSIFAHFLHNMRHERAWGLSYMLFLLSLTFLIFSPVCYGLESKAVVTPHSTGTLITDSDSFDERHPLHVALRLQLKPGWHTYWLNPGDAGDPVRVDITATGAGSGNSQTINWPVPQQIKEGSLISNAYTGDTVLPIDFVISPQTHRDLRNDPHILKLKAISSWLVCKDSCIPEYGDFTLEVPKGKVRPSAQKKLIDNTLANLPQQPAWPVELDPPATLVIHDKNLTSQKIKDVHFIPQERGVIVESAQQFPVYGPTTIALHLTPTADFSSNEPLSGLLELTFIDGDKEYDIIHAQPRKEPPANAKTSPQQQASSSDRLHFLDLILFAFVGGLILNLMPCVFPVLAMKIMAFTRMTHQEQAHRQRNALAYGAGTVATFTFLGLMIMTLRYFGVMAGWGVQFQSPVFVSVILWFLFLIALDLLGVYTFRFPSFSVQWHFDHDLIDNFVTGILAVIVASPCTAPFMGVAVAGALNTLPLAGLFVFATLGLGLATPYVALSYYPALMSYMPRPGEWMVYLQKALAFPLFISCAWLLWVATREDGSLAAFYIGLGLTVIGCVAWLWGDYQRRQQQSENPLRLKYVFLTVSFCAALLLLLFLALLPDARERATQSDFSVDVPGSVSFSKDKLKWLHSQGKPVFVDMTAAWCITCIANEHMVLNTAPVRYAFEHNHVVFMQGDWTHRDESITRFLRDYRHDGVPFYLFLPAHGTPTILPQILTQDLVIKTISQLPQTPVL